MVYIAIILLLRVVQNFFSKKASTVFPKTGKGRIKYSALTGTVSALLGTGAYLVWGDGGITWLTVVLAAVVGGCIACNSVLGNIVMQSSSIALYIVFSTAGMLIPIFLGPVLFNETVSWPVFVFLAVFLVSVYLLSSSSKKMYGNFSVKTLLLLIVIFLFSGLTMLGQKCQTWYDPDGSITMFSLLTFAIPAAVFGVILAVGKKEGGEKLDKKLYFPLVCLAIAVFFINQLATTATKSVSSVVLFSFINGGNTIIAAIVGAVCYKEKLTVKSVIGILLSVLSLVGIKLFCP